MIRAASGRAHFRCKEEFGREMERVEAELQCEASGRFTIDLLFARMGYVTRCDGSFVQVLTGRSA